MDYALDHPGSLYFKGWRAEDFDAAEAWVESCLAPPSTKGDRERQSLLTQRRASLEGRGEVQRNDQVTQQFRDEQIQDQRDKDAALKAQEAARRAEEAKKDARRHHAADIEPTIFAVHLVQRSAIPPRYMLDVKICGS
jgi:hypothetical protein